MMKFAKLSLLSLALATTPVIATMFVPVQAEAQAFSSLRQAIAEASSTEEQLAAFYRERDFQPIWTTAEAADRRNALFTALSRASDHGLPTQRYDADALRAAFEGATNPYMMGQVDVQASLLFLQYAQDIHSGFLEPGDIVGDIVHTLPRRDPLELFTEFVDANPYDYIGTLPPQHPEYTRLMRAKLHLENLIDQGGYGPTVQVGALRPGDTGPAVVQLRNRLMAMGFLDRSSTATFDARLQQAVTQFQIANGIQPDGVAGGATMTAINRSASDHLSEVILSMERQRWLNFDRGARHVFVNLPDFHTRVIDNGEVTFITRSVIGSRESDRRTPEFSDTMEHMVINPSWYVPRSIARGYIPSILAGGANHLQLMANGRPVSRANVDWSRVSAGNFPFDLRQPPGPRNALGLVKFMFPNQWNIYLHDSPDQHLMTHEVRAYSAGCVRLDDPFDFAYHLLAAQEEDPVDFFHRVLDSGRETQVNLVDPIPVHIVYWTSWVDTDGRLNFRNDLYGRNAQLQRAIQNLGVEIRGVNS
ncbi:L,D-transpeptidase family protein [Gymnodinialimonas sp. 2305UL16-5]|uniref:L,D-transpeptidase family protein n=1 Tax=Gymnodinialimonas mytili TaxID=3126503 RepID=UPI0030AE1D7B